MQQFSAVVGVLVDGLVAIGVYKIEDIVAVFVGLPHLSPFAVVFGG